MHIEKHEFTNRSNHTRCGSFCIAERCSLLNFGEPREFGGNGTVRP